MRLRPLAAFVLAPAVLAGCAKRAPERGQEKTRDAAPMASVTVDGKGPLPGLTAASGRRVDACEDDALPSEQHFAADGLCVTAVATRQGRLRDIEALPNGDLIGVRATGEIMRYRDVNANGRFDAGTSEILEWAKTGAKNAHGCAFYEGYLYCGSEQGVTRYQYSPEGTAAGPGENVVTGQPSGGNYPIHPVKVYDGFLYVVSASAKNTLVPLPDDYDRARAVLRRFPLASYRDKPLDWRDGEVLVTGLRNATAFGRGPKGRLYAVVNNLDDLHYAGVDVHADNPGEILVTLDAGRRYGWPFCFHAARIVKDGKALEPGLPLAAEVLRDGALVRSNKDDAWCAANVDRPMSFLQAHSSALDIEFVTSSAVALPARYRGGAFVALHGSWNRDQPTGYKVVWMPFDGDGTAPMPEVTARDIRYPYQVVFGGGKRGAHRDGDWSWKVGDAGETSVRPVGLAIGGDGALYVSSDNAPVGKGPSADRNQGGLYRIRSRR